MKVLTRSMSVVLTVLCAGTLVANVAPAAPDQVRAQLSSYFKNIGTNSPTVLGGLAKSPEAMAAVQERIAKMSDAEAAKLQKLLSETPDWQIAPEAFAGAFPPEMLEQIKRVGAGYTAAIPKAEKMLDDVRTLVEVLKRVPDTRLQELGIDRKMIASLGTTFEQMTPLQVAMLQRQATDANGWNEKSALAIHTLPPALQRGAMALTAHGPLSEKDIAELNMFRDELVSVLRVLGQLPGVEHAFEQHDRRMHAGGAQGDPLFEPRHGERIGVRQRERGRDESVAVRVRLDHRHDLRTRRVRADRAQVVAQRRRVDQRPDQSRQRMIPSPYAGSA